MCLGGGGRGLDSALFPQGSSSPSCLILGWRSWGVAGPAKLLPWFPALVPMPLCSEFTCSGRHLHHGLITLTHHMSFPLTHILPHPHHMEHHWIRGLSVCPEQAAPSKGLGSPGWGEATCPGPAHGQHHIHPCRHTLPALPAQSDESPRASLGPEDWQSLSQETCHSGGP